MRSRAAWKPSHPDQGSHAFIRCSERPERAPRDFCRWNKGKALPHAVTERQLLELEFVIDKLADIWEPHDARPWSFARQRLLDDQVPAELIQQGRVDEVLASVTSCSTACICETLPAG